MQRLVGLVSSPHKAYARAYDLYEGYTRKVHLGLGVPTPEQVLAARVSSELIEAEELYQKALALCREKRLGPNETVVLYQLGLLRRLQGKPEEAIPLFERALQRFQGFVKDHPGMRESVSMTHFYLGQALLAAGRPDAGRPHLETAIALDEAMGDERRVAATRELLKLIK